MNAINKTCLRYKMNTVFCEHLPSFQVIFNTYCTWWRHYVHSDYTSTSILKENDVVGMQEFADLWRRIVTLDFVAHALAVHNVWIVEEL